MDHGDEQDGVHLTEEERAAAFVRSALAISLDQLRSRSTFAKAVDPIFPHGTYAGTPPEVAAMWRKLLRTYAQTEQAILWLAEAVTLLRKREEHLDGCAIADEVATDGTCLGTCNCGAAEVRAFLVRAGGLSP